MKIYNLFPLTIIKSKIDLTDDEKNKTVKLIKDMKNNSKNLNYKNKASSWTGDTQGFDELHNDTNFKKLFDEIKKKITEYLDILSIDHNQFDIYIQRSWATISQGKESINKHKHMQSHLSFAYYLKKSKEDSKIIFFDEYKHNEFIPSLFESPSIKKKEIIKKVDIYNADNAAFEVEEGDIVIFPSKTLHGTQPNIENNERISIAADVSLLAKDAKSLEHLLPPVKAWRKIN